MQYELESRLNSSTKNVHVGDTGPMDAKAHDERAQLIELVKRQANDIEALKAEIHILRRKGGHVYAAIAPQSRQAPAAAKPASSLLSKTATLAASNAHMGAQLAAQQAALMQQQQQHPHAHQLGHAQLMLAPAQSLQALGVHGSRTGTARDGSARGGGGGGGGLGAVDPPAASAAAEQIMGGGEMAE